jgi:hypothetical protein
VFPLRARCLVCSTRLNLVGLDPPDHSITETARGELSRTARGRRFLPPADESSSTARSIARTWRERPRNLTGSAISPAATAVAAHATLAVVTRRVTCRVVPAAQGPSRSILRFADARRVSGRPHRALETSADPTIASHLRMVRSFKRHDARAAVVAKGCRFSSLNSRLGVAEPVCDALQQRVHAPPLVIFSFISLMKGGELHPARNPRIGAGIDKESGDSQRTLAGDVAKSGVADPCLLVRVHICRLPRVLA